MKNGDENWNTSVGPQKTPKLASMSLPCCISVDKFRFGQNGYG